MHTRSWKCPCCQDQVSEHVYEYTTWLQIPEWRDQNVPRCNRESGERRQEIPSEVSGSEVLQSESIEFVINTKIDLEAA